MAEAHTAVGSIRHPAPHRERASLGLLAVGLAAAPLAWVGQLVVNFGLASHVCFPGGNPLHGVVEGRATVWLALLIVELVALAIALGAAAAAFAAWRATRQESSGDTEDMMEAGRGRTRFLAVWGLMTSLGFALAIGFSLIGVFTVPLCGY